MQVNPNPPGSQATRSTGLGSIKTDDGGDGKMSNPGARFDSSIDGVLLGGQQEAAEYSAIQHQLAQQNNYAPAPRAHDRNVYSLTSKPLVGTDEWYKVRKDNHKEVERRRRETINRGIDELAKVVPDCDKHKGQILARSLEYIKKLKENEHEYLEKTTLEKIMAEQAIADLTNTNKKLTAELSQAWKEVDHWKRQAKSRNA